jgi:hypothetical protein
MYILKVGCIAASQIMDNITCNLLSTTRWEQPKKCCAGHTYENHFWPTQHAHGCWLLTSNHTSHASQVPTKMQDCINSIQTTWAGTSSERGANQCQTTETIPGLCNNDAIISRNPQQPALWSTIFIAFQPVFTHYVHHSICHKVFLAQKAEICYALYTKPGTLTDLHSTTREQYETPWSHPEDEAENIATEFTAAGHADLEGGTVIDEDTTEVAASAEDYGTYFPLKMLNGAHAPRWCTCLNWLMTGPAGRTPVGTGSIQGTVHGPVKCDTWRNGRTCQSADHFKFPPHFLETAYQSST